MKKLHSKQQQKHKQIENSQMKIIQNLEQKIGMVQDGFENTENEEVTLLSTECERLLKENHQLNVIIQKLKEQKESKLDSMALLQENNNLLNSQIVQESYKSTIAKERIHELEQEKEKLLLSHSQLQTQVDSYSDLNEKINLKNQEISQLKNQNFALQELATDQTWKNRCQDLESQLSKTLQESQQLSIQQSQKSDSQQQNMIQEFKIALQDRETQIESFIKIIENLEIQKESQSQKINELQELLQSTSTKQSPIKSPKKPSKIINKLKSQLSTLNHTLQSKNQEIHNISLENNDLIEELNKLYKLQKLYQTMKQKNQQYLREQKQQTIRMQQLQKSAKKMRSNLQQSEQLEKIVKDQVKVIKSLEQVILDRDNEIGDLAIENERLRNENNSQNKKEQEKQSVLRKSQEQWSMAESQYITLIKKQEEKVVNMELQIKQYQNEQEDMQKQLQKIGILIQNNDRLNQLVEEKNKEINQLQKIVNASVKITSDQTTSEAKTIAYQTQIQQLQQKVIELEQTNQSQSNLNKSLIQEMQHKMRKSDTIQNKHDDYVRSYNVELNSLRNQLESFKRSSLDIKELSMKFGKEKLFYDQEIKQLRELQGSQEGEMQQLYELLEQRKKDQEIHETTIFKLREENSKLTDFNLQLQEDLKHLNEQNQIIKAENDELKHSRNLYKDQSDYAHKELNQSNSELIKSIADLENVKQRYRVAENRYQKLESDLRHKFENKK